MKGLAGGLSPNQVEIMKRTLDIDPLMASQQIFHANEQGDKFTIETKQDVSGIIKEAKAARIETDKHTRYGDMTKVASIPMTIYQDWVKKGYTKDQKKMKQLLNSPELRYFRTREGKV